MRVFITGAAGFIGAATTKELIANGHSVLGLARSDANAAALAKLGAEVHRGSLEDVDSLARGARETDGTIHLAFIHDFSKFEEVGQVDKRAIDAMGDALAGSGKPLIVTSGTLLLAAGRLATEKDPSTTCWRSRRRKAYRPLSATAATVGPPHTAPMWRVFIDWRWRRGWPAPVSTRCPTKACACATSPR